MCYMTVQLTNDITLELIHILLGLCNAPVYLTQHGCNLHTLPLTSFLCLQDSEGSVNTTIAQHTVALQHQYSNISLLTLSMAFW